MSETHGISHISLSVSEPQRSLASYRAAQPIQVQGPDPFAVFAFERGTSRVGAKGGGDHFSFRLKRAVDIDDTIAYVEQAGGNVPRQGAFAPSYPLVSIADPGG